MTKNLTSFMFTIFGSTGDLAKRKLFPALYYLYRDKLLPENFAVVAVGRREMTTEELKEDLLHSIEKYSRLTIDRSIWEGFVGLFHYFRGDFNESESYEKLGAFLTELDTKYHTQGNYIFYLAVAPQYFSKIVDGLHREGIVGKNKASWQRVVIEKPFGTDLDTAKMLNRQIREVFEEEDIYRIDHYLGKEMIQNIMVIRFANTFFEPVWNSKFIDNIQINSSETGGIEERGGYYEQAGALRDMMQNHMLQLLTMVAMEPPSNLDTESVRDEKVKVLRSLRPLTTDLIRKNIVRGQYGGGVVNGERLLAYREEDKVSPQSMTETFIAMKLFVENFRWAGVPFYLRTGKEMPVKSTEVIIQFKSLPEILYFKEYGEMAPNLLVIRIQPQEGIFLQLNAKKPGSQNFFVPVKLDFCQNNGVGLGSPEAYERLLYDVIRGDSTLFTRWDEVEHSWKFIDPIAEEWEQTDPLFPNYPPGQWGPEAAQSLLLKEGRKWWDVQV